MKRKVRTKLPCGWIVEGRRAPRSRRWVLFVEDENSHRMVNVLPVSGAGRNMIEIALFFEKLASNTPKR